MPYTEKCTSKIKSGHAFLMCLGVIILTVLLARSIPLEKYKVFVELFVVLFVGSLLYLLYDDRPHVYLGRNNIFCQPRRRRSSKNGCRAHRRYDSLYRTVVI